MLEVYISCRSCPHEQEILSGPRQVVELELDIERLRGKALAGEPLESVLRAREEALAELKRHLKVAEDPNSG